MTANHAAVVDDDHDEDDHMFSQFNSDLARLDSEAEAILNSIRNEETSSETPSSCRSSSPVIHDDSCSDECSSHEDEIHDDDEMNDEITRLESVVASLQQDLDITNITTVTSATLCPMSELPSSTHVSPCPESSKLISCSDGALNFIHSKQLCSPRIGGMKMSVLLLLANVLIWGAVIALVIHVQSATLNEDGGGLTYLPTFGNS